MNREKARAKKSFGRAKNGLNIQERLKAQQGALGKKKEEIKRLSGRIHEERRKASKEKQSRNMSFEVKRGVSKAKGRTK